MSNVVELRPKRTDAQKYYEALAKQRGIKHEPSLSDIKQDWLLHLADNGNLSRAAIRVGIVVQACRTNHAGKIDWPLARKSLAFLNYKPSTLDGALFELQCAGLLSSPAASNTAS
jgi:hypothetical protein